MTTVDIAALRLTGARSQQAFDVCLRTLSEPGRLRSFPADVLDLGLHPAAVPALCLADVELGVAAPDDPELARAVAEATGATVVALDQALFPVLTAPTPTQLANLAVGSALSPEDGAKAALAVTALHALPAEAVDAAAAPGPTDGPATTLELRGPGVPGVRRLRIEGLDPATAAGLGRASASFPAGFDVWLVDRTGAVAAIPRSTTVTVTTTTTDRPTDGSAPTEED